MQGKTRIRYKDASENVFKIMLRTAGRYFEKKETTEKTPQTKKTPHTNPAKTGKPNMVVFIFSIYKLINELYIHVEKYSHLI